MTSPRRIAFVLVFALTGALACASNPAAIPETSVMPQRSDFIAGNGNLTLGSTREFVAISTTVPVKPDSAYALLEAAYKKLGLPVTRSDLASRSLGNDALKARHKIGGLAMQNAIDCGEKMGVRIAETWDIQLNILSYVTEDGRGGSKISTRIQALGLDPVVSGRDFMQCSTRGELENKIGNVVKLLTVPPKK